MIPGSWRKAAAAFVISSFAFVAWGGAEAGSRPAAAVAAQSQSTESGSTAQPDRSQWRQLKRRMTKDDVKKLLGEPTRISVSRFYEEWDYPRGTIIFDGKGRVDAWSEL
jgi:outer membrane protein assembly factor BamE (lipoprotein component of BamABCDE complex)